MKPRSRLKHAAAGILGSLISRNNDVNGYWAPGVLYRDASAPPHMMELDMLTVSSQPASDGGKLVAACYAAFLRDALEKQAFGWHELTQATIKFQFNAEVSDPYFNYPGAGDPFICTVTLHTSQGLIATVSARARCCRYRFGLFSRSGLRGPRPPARLNRISAR